MSKKYVVDVVITRKGNGGNIPDKRERKSIEVKGATSVSDAKEKFKNSPWAKGNKTSIKGVKVVKEGTNLIENLKKKKYAKVEMDVKEKLSTIAGKKLAEMKRKIGEEEKDCECGSDEDQIKEKQDYKEFFKKALDKFGVKSPAELKGDKEKEFYDYVDSNWKGDKEVAEDDKDPCWNGYEMIGMKDKDGKKVPNCVKEDALEETKKGHTHYEINVDTVNKKAETEILKLLPDAKSFRLAKVSSIGNVLYIYNSKNQDHSNLIGQLEPGSDGPILAIKNSMNVKVRNGRKKEF